MPLPTFPFVVLDTETTGLTARVHRVIEFAMVRYENGEKVAEWESLFSVDDELPPLVRVLTRIQPEDLQGKPTFSDQQSHIEKLIEGAVIVGQNIPFDLDMLAGEGLDLRERPHIDTSMLASIVYPELESYSLGYLSDVLALPHEPKHRAMGDVMATTALLEQCFDRLNELPADMMKQIKAYAEKGAEGYKTFFLDLGEGGEKKPEWLENTKHQALSTKKLPINVILSGDEGPKSQSARTWVAVKNLDATLREFDVGDLVPVFAPTFLLNPESKDALLKQDAFTVDELTLAMKFLLYEGERQAELPIHGSERDVWKGKLACTKESAAYVSQFSNLRQGSGRQADVSHIIDHRQLLELLHHEHEHAPKKGDAVIIDDASMLEDTATKAFKWSCSIDPLRAAAEGNAELTSFLDALQMWLEKVRNMQDIRYIVPPDLQSKEAKGIAERTEEMLKIELNDQAREQLEDLQNILNPENLDGRITYIEQFRDGGSTLHSAPQDVASLLNTVLYSKYETTLLMPPGDDISAIVPVGADAKIECSPLTRPYRTTSGRAAHRSPLRYADEHMTIDRLLPRIDGKVIGLVGSKRTIEQLYIKYDQMLEETGITLIAQGTSGGVGRMTAEFHAAKGPTVWLMTPWLYESIELPNNTVDHLWIHTLPFDHPKHAVLSIRAEKLGYEAFNSYFVPRLLHRLFRILRTFGKHKTEDADVIVFDQRLHQKAYGERVKEYLDRLVS